MEIFGIRRRCVFALALSWGCAGQLSAAMINYGFEDGTLDGWTNVMSDPSASPHATAFAPLENNPSSANAPNTTYGSGADGVWQVAPDVASFDTPIPDGGGDQQDDTPETLVLTSPTFTLDNTGSITFALTGGTGDASSPANDNFNMLPTSTSMTGFEGVALRDTATGAYLLSATNPGNPDETMAAGANSYTPLGFTNAQLAAAGVLGNGTVLQLDLINNFFGGWGWVAMDNVTVNGVVAVPEPSSLVLLGLGGAIAGALALLRRGGRPAFRSKV